MKCYIVYLDVLGYSDNLKRNSSIALKKIQKFYSIIAENVKAPDQNILLLYSDCTQLVFETLEEALFTTEEIFKCCHRYNRECKGKDRYNRMIFLRGGISIDYNFNLLPVPAIVNKAMQTGP